MRFGDCPEWMCGMQAPRSDMLNGVRFDGSVWGETPALRKYAPEMRRKDVGAQRYGTGTPQFNGDLVDRNGLVSGAPHTYSSFPTSHGKVSLGNPVEPDRGWLPTAEGVLFLREQYGTRLPEPPLRYYPK